MDTPIVLPEDLPLSPTQRRVITVLLDGEWHTKQELRDQLEDELAGRNAIDNHLTQLRLRLKLYGWMIPSRRDGYRTESRYCLMKCDT